MSMCEEATMAMDYTITNHAPDCDAITLRVTQGGDNVLLSVWREDDGSITVQINDSDGNEVLATLGEPGTTMKL